jgi:hypothetical protein
MAVLPRKPSSANLMQSDLSCEVSSTMWDGGSPISDSLPAQAEVLAISMSIATTDIRVLVLIVIR